MTTKLAHINLVLVGIRTGETILAKVLLNIKEVKEKRVFYSSVLVRIYKIEKYESYKRKSECI